jgi:hypothetical protein
MPKGDEQAPLTHAACMQVTALSALPAALLPHWLGPGAIPAPELLTRAA